MKYSIFKESKYHNKQTTYDGYKFASLKERNYYIKLKMMQNSGKISDLKLQPKYLLIDTIHYKNKTYPKTYYIADFQYYSKEDNKIHVVDVKSEATRKDKVYRLKIKMLLNKYPDVDFEEIL